MRPLEEMRLRREQADREVALATKLALEELASLSNEATAAVADLEQIDVKALKDHVVAMKATASRVESRIAVVLSAVRRRRTCF